LFDIAATLARLNDAVKGRAARNSRLERAMKAGMHVRSGWVRLLLPTIWFVVGCAGTAPLAPKAVDLNRAGTEALAAGDLPTAEARFALALEYHPRFVEALTNLGLVEMQRGNFARARVQLERARRINGDLAQPHHGLGVLAEREGRPDLAAESYREALRVNPGFAASRGNLARLLFAAARYDDAREQFLRLSQVDPRDIGARAGLVETLLQLQRADESDQVLARGDVRGALEAADRAFAQNRDDPLATYVVAMAMRATRDKRATSWLERARLLAPQNPVIAAEIARARAEKSD
jgi:tetratricopeptide (TPR) repeat protein